MNETTSLLLTDAQRLHNAVAEYRAACAAGRPPDLEQFLAGYSDLAPRLRSLLSAAAASAETFDFAPSAGAATPTIDPVSRSVDPGAPTLDPVAPPVRDSAATLDPSGIPAPTVGPLGRDFGDYELLEEVARGGMGVVFRARQKSLNRVVALKMILAGQLASPDQVRRFRVEAEEAGQLDHPHIVPIYQVGELNGQHYFTMRLVEGGSLSVRLSDLRRDRRRAVQLLATVARAVHYAHQRGVLHRDLKPGNILVDNEGQPHVTDFGLAKHLEGNASDTQSGAIVGTPGYVAPEQAAAVKHLTTAADVYGLGAILYELLTGRPPFKGPSAVDTLLMVLEQEPTPPRCLDAHVDRDLDTITLKCLEKDPRRRYISAAALADDLERYLNGEPIQARPVGRVERVRKWVRRRPAAAALLGVSTVAALTLLGGGWWYSTHLAAALREADVRRAEAEDQRARAERRQQELDASFLKRQNAVDDMIRNFDLRLSGITGAEPVRVEFLQECLKLSHDLLQERGTDPTARRQAARLYQHLADLERDQGDAAAAEESYAQALELQRRLAAESPGRPELKAELAVTIAQRAEALRRLKRYGDARAGLEETIALYDALAAAGTAGHRARAARTRFVLADLLEQADRKTEAAALYRTVLAEQETQAAAAPRDVALQADVARTAAALALLREPADIDETQRLQERSLAAWGAAFRLPTAQRTAYGQELRQAYEDTDAFLVRHSRHTELAKLAERICQDFPDDPDNTYNAACFAANAMPLTAAGSGEADRYGKLALEYLDRAIRLGQHDREHMAKDADLDPLRDRPDFQALMADLDKRFPGKPVAPIRVVKGLAEEYENRVQRHQTRTTRVRTTVELRRAEADQPDPADYSRRFLRLAGLYRDGPAALEALAWVLQNCPADGASAAKVRAEALATLRRDHFPRPEMADVLDGLAENPSPEGDELLREAAEKHPLADVRGQAAFALAGSLTKQARESLEKNASGAAEQCARAEHELERVVRDFATVAHGKSTLGEAAKTKLHDLRSLSVGRPAAEIDGEDLDGQRMKLSDYRGKVVVLDFWANWCGFCRRMYPHERGLVERLKNEPFALVGINCDPDKEDARLAVVRNQLSWPSWWDAGGRELAQRWQVEGYPRVFVLDHKGVIRFRSDGYVKGPDLDTIVDKLVAEAKAGR